MGTGERITRKNNGAKHLQQENTDQEIRQEKRPLPGL